MRSACVEVMTIMKMLSLMFGLLHINDVFYFLLLCRLLHKSVGRYCRGTIGTDIIVFMYRSLYVDIQKKCVGKIHVDSIISISINNHEEV